MTFTLSAFFGQNMTTMGFAAFNRTAGRAGKAFSCPTIGFHFWHVFTLRIFKNALEVYSQSCHKDITGFF
jgi:hypothetical protein